MRKAKGRIAALAAPSSLRSLFPLVPILSLHRERGKARHAAQCALCTAPKSPLTIENGRDCPAVLCFPSSLSLPPAALCLSIASPSNRWRVLHHTTIMFRFAAPCRARPPLRGAAETRCAPFTQSVRGGRDRRRAHLRCPLPPGAARAQRQGLLFWRLPELEAVRAAGGGAVEDGRAGARQPSRTLRARPLSRCVHELSSSVPAIVAASQSTRSLYAARASPAWLGSSCAARAPPSTTSMCLSRTPAPTRRRPTTTTRSVAAGEGWLATPQPKLPPCARRLPRLVLLLTIRSTRTLRHP